MKKFVILSIIGGVLFTGCTIKRTVVIQDVPAKKVVVKPVPNTTIIYKKSIPTTQQVVVKPANETTIVYKSVPVTTKKVIIQKPAPTQNIIKTNVYYTVPPKTVIYDDYYDDYYDEY